MSRTPRQPRVLIVYTGGTFGMDSDLRLPRLDAEGLELRLAETVPELPRLAKCDVEVLFNRDSAHIGPREWIEIARRIQDRWEKYDGVVVLHGTDTLVYTASALSFLLRPCLRPVVLTGAQRPLASLLSDARRNLVTAVEIAGHGPRARVGQVLIFFDDVLLQGNRARKRSASDFGAFESPKAPPIATVGTDIRYDRRIRLKRGRAPKLEPRFSHRVAMLHVTPGLSAKLLKDQLLSRLDGLVLVTFASGTGPTNDPDFLAFLRAARKKRVPVIVTTESSSTGAQGIEHPSAYEAGRAMLREGCLWAGALTPECAYVKASLILGQKNGRKNFARLWKKSYAAEG